LQPELAQKQTGRNASTTAETTSHACGQVGEKSIVND
jgi:hypothetical protein